MRTPLLLGVFFLLASTGCPSNSSAPTDAGTTDLSAWPGTYKGDAVVEGSCGGQSGPMTVTVSVVDGQVLLTHSAAGKCGILRGVPSGGRDVELDDCSYQDGTGWTYTVKAAASLRGTELSLPLAIEGYRSGYPNCAGSISGSLIRQTF